VETLVQDSTRTTRPGGAGSSGGRDVARPGIFGDPQQRDTDPDYAELVLRTNLLAPVRLLTLLAPRLRRGLHRGPLVGRGRRGRAKVGVYGASKRPRFDPLGPRQRLQPPECAFSPSSRIRRHADDGRLPKTPLFASAAEWARGGPAVDSGATASSTCLVVAVHHAVVKSLPERVFKKLSF